jgi:hypothetical protein
MPDKPSTFIVYELRHPDGRPFYVGKGLRRRPKAHLTGRTNPHCARTIAAIRRDGSEPMVVIVFETDDEQAAFAEEVRLIAHYGREHLTNLTDGGEGFRGGRHTPESRAKFAASLTGRTLREETRARISAAKVGVPRPAFTDEARANMSAAHKAQRRPLSPETRTKISNALSGRSLTAEHRTNISAGQLGKPGHPYSDATRAKVSAANTGRVPWNKRKLTAQPVDEAILSEIPDGL